MKNRTKKIFVGGVPTDMSEDTLRNYFIQYGEVGKRMRCEGKGETLGRSVAMIWIGRRVSLQLLCVSVEYLVTVTIIVCRLKRSPW